MARNWKSAVIEACARLAVAAVAVIPALSATQVAWVTPLAPGAQQQIWTSFPSAVAAPNGNFYWTAFASDGEVSRLRIAQMTTSGVVNWVRWAGTGEGNPLHEPVTHADNSVTVVYRQNSSTCVENFDVTGNRRMRDCWSLWASTQNTDLTVSADDDFVVAAGDTRVIRKYSTSGVLRWQSTMPYVNGTARATGIRSGSEYYEVNGNKWRSWSLATGAVVSQVQLAGTMRFPSYNTAAAASVTSSNGDLVLISGTTTSLNSTTVDVSSYKVDGSVRWTRPLQFTSTGGGETLSLLGSDNGTIFLTRSGNSASTGSDVVKLSVADGAVLWQRNYATAYRVLPGRGELNALGVSISASGTVLTGYGIAASDGALVPFTTYTINPPTQAPKYVNWIPGGIFVAYGEEASSATVASWAVFLSNSPNVNWYASATRAQATSVKQSDCLMPRLAASSALLPQIPASSPTAHWRARTQLLTDNAVVADWTSVAAAGGNVVAKAPQPRPGCGDATTPDGGRIVVQTSSPRVAKYDVNNAVVWQAPAVVAPTYSSWYAPMQATAANGDHVYRIDNLLGRVKANGTRVFEVDMGYAALWARFMALDALGNVLVVSDPTNGNGPTISKVSPTGTLLWTASIDAPTCSDVVTAAKMTSTDEMLVATRTCNEGRIYRINASGQVLWQRLVSGTTLRPYVDINALTEDVSGNVFAGGCAANASGNSAISGSNGVSVLASWSASGSERWSTSASMFSNASGCVSSIAVDHAGNVFAASTSTDPVRAPVLWALTNAGIERWRSAGVLSAPNAANTELATDATGAVFALGDSALSVFGPPDATLRRIDITAIASPHRLKFLEVLPAHPTLIAYQTNFTVRVGIRTSLDAVATVSVPTVVTLGVQVGTGTLNGTLSCTIPAGGSECVLSDVRYDVVESGVLLSASADGFSAVVSSALGFKAATTTTTLRVLNDPPHSAFSVVRVRAELQAPLPRADQGVSGYLNGPSPASYLSSLTCESFSGSGILPSAECDVLLFSAALPMTAQFYANGNTLTSSVAPPLTLTLTKATSTLAIEADPANTYVAGDRVRFRVSLLTAGGFNVTPFVQPTVIGLSAGSCTGSQQVGSTSTGWAGSYFTCEIPSAPLGANSVTAQFGGNQDLLPAAPVTLSFAMAAGGVIRGYANTVSVASICTTTPGVTCSVIADSSGNWQCVGPAGMSGEVFFVPPAGVDFYNYPGTPVHYSNVTGVVSSQAQVTWRHQLGACKMDVDGDGAVLGLTDGVIVLRRMFGLQGASLLTGATHSCVPKTSAQISADLQLSAYDIDGDGQTLPTTDGLLLLRALLGFRGDALIADAVSATATRKAYTDIRNFLSNSCYFAIN